MTLSPRLAAFLKALPDADPQSWVAPPGLGLMRAKHCLSGMQRGILVMHNSGLGLAFVIPARHGVCRECASAKTRSTCSHCNCSLCIWENEVAERNSPPPSIPLRARVQAQLNNFRFAKTKPVEVLDAELGI